MIIKRLVILLLLSFLFIVIPSVAACEPQPCPFDESEYDYVLDVNEKIRSDGDGPSSLDIPVNLTPGVYRIGLFAEDGYEGREHETQPNEQYFLSFMNGGNQITKTLATNDLYDYVGYAHNTRTFDNFFIGDNIDLIKAVHYKIDEVPTESPNSVRVVCIGIDKMDEPIVPEFGTIVGLVTLIGALGMFFAVRR
jgi:dihydroneopterin aldolase